MYNINLSSFSRSRNIIFPIFEVMRPNFLNNYCPLNYPFSEKFLDILLAFSLLNLKTSANS